MDAMLRSLMALLDYGGEDYASTAAQSGSQSDSTLPTIRKTTPSRRRQAANQDAIVALVRRTALIMAARYAATVEFDSYNDAAAIRNDLALRLDAMSAEAPQELYQALQDLRARMVKDITARGGNLARVTSHEIPESTPALVLAHRLYQDATRADEIVARNKIRHPLFVPAGQPLEILTRD